MAGEIVTWETRYGDRTLIEHAAKNPSSDFDLALPAATVADSPLALAYVNHSRWIVKCPDCSGAELASTVRPTFFCCECRNRSNGNQPLPAAMPENKTDIEAALLARSDPAQRNWYPGETVDDLLAETALLEEQQ